jgi:hypothetical protein
MRAIDANVLEKLDMFYGDRDCFASLNDWFGEAENYWNRLKQLLIISDYTNKHKPSEAKKITALSKIVVELFQQTRNYASDWNSKDNQISKLFTEDYTNATEANWDEFDKWNDSKEKLREKIIDLIELIYASDSEI